MVHGDLGSKLEEVWKAFKGLRDGGRCWVGWRGLFNEVLELDGSCSAIIEGDGVVTHRRGCLVSRHCRCLHMGCQDYGHIADCAPGYGVVVFDVYSRARREWFRAYDRTILVETAREAAIVLMDLGKLVTGSLPSSNLKAEGW